MSIEFSRGDGTFGIFCDQCDEEAMFEVEDFLEGIDEANGDGWVNRKIDGDWMNFCTDECFEAYLQENNNSAA